MIDVGAALLVEGPRIQVCADDDVGIAIAVHVTNPRDRSAKLCFDGIRLGYPGRVVRKTPRPAVVHVGAPLPILVALIAGRADDDVIVAIAVHVSSAGNGEPKDGLPLVAADEPVGSHVGRSFEVKRRFGRRLKRRRRGGLGQHSHWKEQIADSHRTQNEFRFHMPSLNRPIAYREMRNRSKTSG